MPLSLAKYDLPICILWQEWKANSATVVTVMVTAVTSYNNRGKFVNKTTIHVNRTTAGNWY
jgi:hypothetical protein